jgi:molybdate transport system regulatory protein
MAMAGEASRHIRLRIKTAGGEPAIGPGKADLLEAIDETGSISAAARKMGMSFRRAWALVRIMNAAFAAPLVVAETGGPHGGGAALTPEGRAILKEYRAAEEAAMKAALPHIRRIRSRMRNP